MSPCELGVHIFLYFPDSCPVGMLLLSLGLVIADILFHRYVVLVDLSSIILTPYSGRGYIPTLLWPPP